MALEFNRSNDYRKRKILQRICYHPWYRYACLYCRSFNVNMIRTLNYPIVITGSQVSIFNPHSDALNNLIGACKVANFEGENLIPEVLVYFHNTLFPGLLSQPLSTIIHHPSSIYIKFNIFYN